VSDRDTQAPDVEVEAMLDALAHDARQNGGPWQDDWRPGLRRLAELLAEFNARTNLVGDASPHGLAEHLAEAWVVAAATEAVLGHAPTSIVDVGAGAGLEGIALALAFPHARVVAVEPRPLRSSFITLAAQAAGVGHLQVVGKSLHAAQLGAEFELATARAVWPPHEWVPRARDLVTTGGVVAVHGNEQLVDRLAAEGWHTAAQRAVPGTRGHVVAIVRPQVRGRRV
jgi:16S rRNA G527 N7-methylase RsmG